MAALPPEVVLADDNPVDGELAALALSRVEGGLRVRVLPDGTDVVAHLDRQLEAAGAGAPALPALIVADLNMTGLNGLELLAAIRARPRCRDVPVVILSGSDDPEDRRRAAALGAAAYQVKPAQFTDLARLLQELCRVHLPRDARGD